MTSPQLRNKKGTHFLCIARGEAEASEAMICETLEEVRLFFIEAWVGPDDEDGQLLEAMERLQEHNWEDGDCGWDFEIGGVTVKDVFLTKII